MQSEQSYLIQQFLNYTGATGRFWTSYTISKFKFYFLNNQINQINQDRYGVWSFPDGSTVSSSWIGVTPVPTSPSCVAAAIDTQDEKFYPECGFDSSSSYSDFNGLTVNMTVNSTNIQHRFICEVASPCLECQLPVRYGNLTPEYQYGLRVAPNKCIWLFEETGTFAKNLETCKMLTLEPVKLQYAYENQVVKKAIRQLLDDGKNAHAYWIDLVHRGKSEF